MDKKIGKGCGVREAPEGCRSQKWLTRIQPPQLYDLYHPQIYDTCVCNEMTALRGRVLADVPNPTQLGLDITAYELKGIAKKIGVTKKITPEKFIERYSGGKYARYKAAIKSLITKDVDKSDAMVSAFVKSEKMNPGDKNTPPDPRLIQCRSPRFNIACGVFLRMIEHKVYNLIVHGLKVMGKGMTPRQRGENVFAKWNRYKNPVALAIDASRFDQHVSLSMLKLEHKLYLDCHDDPEFRRLLAFQEYNFGYTSHGIKYNTVGRRMSGDLNTAVGNCALMLAMTNGLLKHAGVKRYDLCVDGDDTIIILDQSEEHKLANLEQLFLMVGHEIKLERRSTTFEGIQWCQSRMCFIDGKPTSVRNYRKVISSTCAGTQLWDKPEKQTQIAHMVGLGLLAENLGVPILQEYATKLISLGSGKLKEWDNMNPLNGLAYDVKSKFSYKQLCDLKPEPITLASRVSYGKAWNITVEEQLEIEEQVSKWEVIFGEPLKREAELQSGWKFECHPIDALP